jgi:type IV secretion system protein VirB5
MKKLFFAIGLIFSFQSLWAFGWPVIDFEAIIQDVKIYNSNMQILHNGVALLSNAKQQLVNGKNQLISMTQISTYANMLNSPADIEARLYTAQSWQDALNGKSKGNNAAYQKILNSYEKKHPEVTAKEYRSTHTKKQYQQFDEHQKTVKTVAATSQNEYSNTNKYIQNITAIGKEASGANNTGVKTAIDLNTRMTEQLGYLIASNIRLESVNNNLASSNEQQALDKQKTVDQFYSV